jgi:hypothetical protein
MNHGDSGPSNITAEKVSGMNAIIQVLRKYLDNHVPSEKSFPGSTNEGLIIKVLKRYFKGDGWA